MKLILAVPSYIMLARTQWECFLCPRHGLSAGAQASSASLPLSLVLVKTVSVRVLHIYRPPPVAQVGPESPNVCLPQPPEFWDYWSAAITQLPFNLLSICGEII